MDKYDFCGWATKSGLMCTDGVTIAHGAFKKNDGSKVPLAWNHQHSDPSDILGYAMLEYRPEGMYAKCSLNDTANAQLAKNLIQHGDIDALSILAQGLVRQGLRVIDGNIKEVSLVFAGANPGAHIDNVIMHSAELSGEATVIVTDSPLEITADSEDIPEDSVEVPVDKPAEVPVANADNIPEPVVVEVQNGELNDTIAHSGVQEPAKDKDETDDQTIQEIFDSFTEPQKNVVYGLIGGCVKEALAENSDDNTSDETEKNKGGNSTMKHNVFEKTTTDENGTTLTHSCTLDAVELADIFGQTSRNRYGSLKDSVIAHGITNIEYLKPEAGTLVDNGPTLITRDMTWVQRFMGGIRKTPFSKVRSLAANLTEDDARAKGYVKGKLKVEEVFSLLKRTTSPATIYKKQRLERDDVLDIIDFDVVNFLKTEMRMMLDEEAAVAALIGDGRLSSSDDKVDEQCIRPIWTDADLYTIKKTISVAANELPEVTSKKFIKEVVRARKDYKGSGNPICFTTEDVLTECLLMEDSTGRVIYDTVEKLATALRVKEIITVPAMENKTRTVDTVAHKLMAIIVNPVDYTVGADKGGSATMFDDFDINYNKMLYLIETRFSGALTRPYSAIVVESIPAV